MEIFPFDQLRSFRSNLCLLFQIVINVLQYVAFDLDLLHLELLISALILPVDSSSICFVYLTVYNSNDQPLFFWCHL